MPIIERIGNVVNDMENHDETTRYLLVAYKPNYMKAWRGEIEDYEDSEMELHEYGDINNAVRTAVSYKKENYRSTKEQWQYAFFVNGTRALNCLCKNIWCDICQDKRSADPRGFHEQVEEQFNDWVVSEKEKERLKIEAEEVARTMKQKQKKEEDEKREHEQYQKLKQKYEGSQ